MRRVPVLLLLLVTILSYAVSFSPVLAEPISPSTGCKAASGFSLTVQASSYTFGPFHFYDDDTLKIKTNKPVNVHYGNTNVINVTSLTVNIAATNDYTFVIASVSGSGFQLAMSCTPTTISAGCIVTNSYFVGSYSITNPTYNAGEQLHVTSDAPVIVKTIGPMAVTSPQTMNFTLTFTQTGIYRSVSIAAATARTPHGKISCTLPN